MEILDLSKMTIREIESKIKHYELQLEYYLNVKEKMFNRTQPKSVKFADEMVQGGKRGNVILDYLIAVEDIDKTIDELQDEIQRLMKYNDETLKLKEEYEPTIALIVELKEIDGLTDEEIGRKMGYCDRHIRRLYSTFKGKRCPWNVLKNAI